MFVVPIFCLFLFLYFKQKGRKRKDFQRSKEERHLETSSDVSEAKKRKAFDADDTNESQENEQVCEHLYFSSL